MYLTSVYRFFNTMNVDIFCQPIDQEYQIKHFDDRDRDEINFSDLAMLTNFNPDLYEHENEEIKHKESCHGNFQKNIFQNSNFNYIHQNLSDFQQTSGKNINMLENYIPNYVFPVNVIYPIALIKKKSQNLKTNNRFRLKYIFNPKWEETISKMKTIMFLAAKNRITSFLDYYKTHNMNYLFYKSKENSNISNAKYAQYNKKLEEEKIIYSLVMEQKDIKDPDLGNNSL